MAHTGGALTWSLLVRAAMVLRVVRLIGASLREAGTLVGVFGILDPMLTGRVTAAWFAGIVVASAPLVGVGIVLEARYERP